MARRGWKPNIFVLLESRVVTVLTAIVIAFLILLFSYATQTTPLNTTTTTTTTTTVHHTPFGPEPEVENGDH